MKNSTSFLLVVALSLFAASQPALAANKKSVAPKIDVVAALLAVSPDPLGGRLGLAAAAAQPDKFSGAQGDRKLTAQADDQAATPDRRAYMSWKAATKS